MPNEIQLSVPPVVSIAPQWFDDRDKLVATCQSIEVKDQDSFTMAEIGLKRITASANEIEKQRKTITKPIDDAKKQVMAMVAEAVAPLESEKDRLKSEMSEFIKAQEKARAEAEEAKAQAAADAAENDPFGGSFDPAQAVAVIQPTAVQRIATAVKKIWRFEITEPALVPREFCMPDERLIREFVQREKVGAAIPGVRTWEDTDVRSR